MHRVDRRHPDYPEGLRGIGPEALRWRGSPLPRPRVAVVGSRRPTPLGLSFATRVGRELGRAGVCVVSGGAFGIDAAAHRGCLEVGGFTAAVVLEPIDRPSPRAHRILFEDIAANGALLADPTLPPRRSSFIQRNRWIAGVADHVVVVEAAAGSGSLSTATFARRFGRPVWAVPGPPGAPLSIEPNTLIKLGAALLDDPKDLLTSLGLKARDSRDRHPILELLDGKPMDAEAVALSLGASLEEVLLALSELEVAGDVRQDRGLYLARR